MVSISVNEGKEGELATTSDNRSSVGVIDLTSSNILDCPPINMTLQDSRRECKTHHEEQRRHRYRDQ